MTVTRHIRSILAAFCLLLAAACPAADRKDESWVLPGFSEHTVRSTPIPDGITAGAVGLWRTTADGALVAVVEGEMPGGKRTMRTTYLLVILKSIRVGIPPGTVMGWMHPTAKDGYYDARLFTSCDGRRLSKPKRFTLRLTDDNHISFVRIHKGLQFTPWRLLPYLFRRAVRERDNLDDDLEGMIRVWPENMSEPVRVRYL